MTTKRKKRKARMPFKATQLLRETMVLVLQSEKRQPIYDLLTARGLVIDNLARVSDWMNGAIGNTARVPRAALVICNQIRREHGLPVWTEAEIDAAIAYDDKMQVAGERIVRTNHKHKTSKPTTAQLSLIFGTDKKKRQQAARP